MQPGLRDGLIIGLFLLTVPLIALIGQCARISAPARDRRFASYRLSGGTKSDIVRIACVETALPAAIGSLLGIASFLAARRMLNGPLTVVDSYTQRTVHSDGPYQSTIVFKKVTGLVHILPTDVALAWPMVALVLAALITVALAVSWISLYAVGTRPLTVMRRQPVMTDTSRTWISLFSVGLIGLMLFSLMRQIIGSPGHIVTTDVVVVLILFTMTALGLVLGCSSISARLGAWISIHSESPALLIAGRRLAADPHSTGRANAVILLTVVIAAAGQAVKADFLAITSPSDTFYKATLHLVDIAYFLAVGMASIGVFLKTLESASNARREMAMLMASGVPKKVLQKSLLWETLIPLIPCTFLATLGGILGARGVLGWAHTQLVGQGVSARLETVVVPFPITDTILLIVFTLAITALLSWTAMMIAQTSITPSELRHTG